MEQPTTMTEVRAAIDVIDTSLIELLAQRQALVEQAGRLKKGQDTNAVRAPGRVAQVIATRRQQASDAGLDPNVAEQIWRAMIDAFIALELRIHDQP